MNGIRHGRKNVVGKQKIFSKYHQLVEKCNSKHVSISFEVQPIDFNKMDSVMPVLQTLL